MLTTEETSSRQVVVVVLTLGSFLLYSSNFIKIFGKVNSTTNPTVVTLKMEASDPHAEGSGTGPDGVPGNADDGFGNDFIDGTFTLNARTHTPDASGSGFSITKPTDSLGSISGS